MQGQVPLKWEDNFEDNRRYKGQHQKVILKGVFNDHKLVDLIEENFPDEIKSHKFIICFKFHIKL